jgi:hypothetical protein
VLGIYLQQQQPFFAAGFFAAFFGAAFFATFWATVDLLKRVREGPADATVRIEFADRPPCYEKRLVTFTAKALELAPDR